MSKREKKAICPKCFELEHLTKHHIYVRRYYGINECIIYFCRNCHTKLERILQSKEMDRKGKLKEAEYLEAVKTFIRH